MATTSITTRTIWIPISASPNVDRVKSELVNKLNTLAFASPKVYRTSRRELSSTLDQEYLEVVVQLTTANDATLVGNFAGWASLLGLALLDTNAVTTTAGH